MANLGKLFAMLNQTYADSGIARVSEIFRDLVLYIRSLRQVFSFDFLIYRPGPHRWFFTTYGKWPPSTFRGDAGTDHSGGAMY
jgi:hypothetical protein